jgi:DNA-binding transcriptional regulator YiaG
VTALRSLRTNLELTQRELAERLGVPANTLRMWDSGVRTIPDPMLETVRELVARRDRELQPLPLAVLAAELNVCVDTLQMAVRTGRLEATFSTRSIFGRPCRFATRAAGARFMADHYCHRLGPHQKPFPGLPTVPTNYHRQLRRVRRRLRLSQAAFAQRIGAAGKAVVYQWESRKRRPSPVFWQRIQALID